MNQHMEFFTLGAQQLLAIGCAQLFASQRPLQSFFKI